MKLTFSIISLLIILQSCGGPIDLEPYMVSPTQFKMDPYILKDGDEVEIIGKSDKVSLAHKIDFYNLVVVRSVETGDTINVLATTFIHPGKNGNYMKFISSESSFGLIIEAQSNNKDLDGKKMKNMKAKKFNKVLFDKELISVNAQKYPTIIGLIGDFTILSDVQKQQNIDEAIDSLLEIQ